MKKYLVVVLMFGFLAGGIFITPSRSLAQTADSVTIQALQAQIASLLAQLNALQAQIAALESGGNSQSGSSAPQGVLSDNLPIQITQAGRYVIRLNSFDSSARQYFSLEPSAVATTLEDAPAGSSQFKIMLGKLDSGLFTGDLTGNLVIVDKNSDNLQEVKIVNEVQTAEGVGYGIVTLSSPLNVSFGKGAQIIRYITVKQGSASVNEILDDEYRQAGSLIKLSHLTQWKSRYNDKGHTIFGPVYSSDPQYYFIQQLSPTHWKILIDDGIHYDFTKAGDSASYNDGEIEITLSSQLNNPTHYTCGDINGDGAINSDDVTALTNYVFKSGALLPGANADLNGDGRPNVLDLTALINYVSRGGPAPTCVASQSQTTLTVSLDSSTFPSQQITMGSTDNRLATFRFSASGSEDARLVSLNVLQKVARIPSLPGGKSSFSSLKLYQGSSLVGIASVPRTSSLTDGINSSFSYYNFNLTNPIVIPNNNSVSLDLRGDVATYASSGTTDYANHSFAVMTSPDTDNSTPSKVIQALGGTTNNPVNVSLSGGYSNPITVLRSKLSVSTTQLGLSTGRIPTTADDLARITLTADTAGPIAIQGLWFRFRGSATVDPNFLDGIKLIDDGGSIVMNKRILVGTTCDGSNDNSVASLNSCYKAFVFGDSTDGISLEAGASRTLTLRIDSTKIAPAQSGVALVLTALIPLGDQQVGVSFADALDSAASLSVAPLVLPPGIQVASVVYVPGTGSVKATLSCGDINADGVINSDDVTVLTNYVSKSGTIPTGVNPDLNGDGKRDVLDMTELINFVYKGGPAPTCVAPQPFPVVTPTLPVGASALSSISSQLSSIGAALNQIINQLAQ